MYDERDDQDEPPEPPPSLGRWAVALGLAGIALGAGWLVSREHPDEPEPLAPPIVKARPAPNAPPVAAAPTPPSGTIRPASPGRSPSAAPAAGTPAPGAPAGPLLRVTSDVAGAFVFLDRKYLGTTPFESRDVPAGSHQLNVSAEGHDGVSRPVQIAADAPTEVNVRLKAVVLNARVDVVHKHAMGSCEGHLLATNAGLRYEPTAGDDAFTVPFSALDAFDVDYPKKTLHVTIKGGRAWNFTTRAENADPLLVFQRDVDKARAKLRTSSP